MAASACTPHAGAEPTRNIKQRTIAEAAGKEGPDAAEWRLIRAAQCILLTPSPHDKAALSLETEEAWARDELAPWPPAVRDRIEALGGVAALRVPDVPARPEDPQLAVDQLMDRCKRVKQGTRKGLLHSIAHAESYAIDLMWDLLARFGPLEHAPALPREFYDGVCLAAGQEARHFLAWCERLDAISQPYGTLATHDGLWESASRTSRDFAARLVVVHCVHEARGLDVYKTTREKLERCSDPQSIAVLDRNVAEEVHHVNLGVKWLLWIAENTGVQAGDLFQSALDKHFCGELKPPFDTELRDRAGMPRHWYLARGTV